MSDDRAHQSGRQPAEGVRIIKAEEAQAAIEAGEAAGRRPDDQLRFGDVPPAPSGPRPAHRFPLPDSVNPAEAVSLPPLRADAPRRHEPAHREQPETPAVASDEPALQPAPAAEPAPPAQPAPPPESTLAPEPASPAAPEAQAPPEPRASFAPAAPPPPPVPVLERLSEMAFESTTLRTETPMPASPKVLPLVPSLPPAAPPVAD